MCHHFLWGLVQQGLRCQGITTYYININYNTFKIFFLAHFLYSVAIERYVSITHLTSNICFTVLTDCGINVHRQCMEDDQDTDCIPHKKLIKRGMNIKKINKNMMEKILNRVYKF